MRLMLFNRETNKQVPAIYRFENRNEPQSTWFYRAKEDNDEG